MIARHEGAGMPWYRGKILSLAGTKVNLLYVDYGQTEVGKMIFGHKKPSNVCVKQLKNKKLSFRFVKLPYILTFAKRIIFKASQSEMIACF